MNRNRWRYHRPLFATPPQPADHNRERFYWKILPMVWRVFRRICTVLGFFLLMSMLAGMAGLYGSLQKQEPPLPDRMALYMDFTGGIQETPDEPSFSDPFSYGRPTLNDIVTTLNKAKNDKRVLGLFMRLDDGHIGLDHVQELRQAIHAFRDTGKFTYVYSSSYGEGGGGFGGYYLASAFDEIWMQPMGVVAVTGIAAEIPFVRSVLDKIGVEPQFFQRKEYKSAYESLTNSEISEPNRQSTQELIDDISATMAGDIAVDRGMTEERFRALVDKGLFTARESVLTGLITTANYADVLVRQINERVTGDPDTKDEVFIDLEYYLEDSRKKHLAEALGPHKPKVALIYAVGMIMPSDGGNGGIAAADEIAPAILDASEDDDVEAIVLRVDSPGGSPGASESILRAVERAQRKGKPVIVSMGSAAASGGYWISAYADMIFAMPTTLTGSIGVVGGKFAAQGLSDKIGVNWETIKWGENSGMWSFTTPFSASEAERFNASLDQVYDGFVARVSQGRHMSPQAVEAIAKGHVWSGARAKELGLVDEIGSLADAMNFTAQMLGAYDRNGLDVVVMPAPKTAFDEFMELVEGQTSVIEGLRLQGVVAGMLKPYSEQLTILRSPEALMTYEPLKIR